jgi:hypothetical protein
MTVLVNYIDFHDDNYQGGSGKSFEFEILLTFSEITRVSELLFSIENAVMLDAESKRPFKNNFIKPVIKQIRMFK